MLLHQPPHRHSHSRRHSLPDQGPSAERRAQTALAPENPQPGHSWGGASSPERHIVHPCAAIWWFVLLVERRPHHCVLRYRRRAHHRFPGRAVVDGRESARAAPPSEDSRSDLRINLRVLSGQRLLYARLLRKLRTPLSPLALT